MSANDSTAALFRLVSEGERIDVLRAVAGVKRRQEVSAEGPIRVQRSEIESEVSLDDQTRLTEHLEALTGPILRRHGEQYSLTQTGAQLLDVVLTEAGAPSIEFDSRSVPGKCPFCGTVDLVASVCKQSLYITCGSCERTAGRYPISAGQAQSWRRRTLLQKVKQRQIATNQQLERGSCPACGGKITTRIKEVSASSRKSSPGSFRVLDTCDVCYRRYSAPLPIRAAYHPASVAFHWQYDIQILTKAPWELYQYLAEEEWTTTRAGYDGAEFEVVLRCEDGKLQCVLDTAATVRRTERQ